VIATFKTIDVIRRPDQFAAPIIFDNCLPGVAAANQRHTTLVGPSHAISRDTDRPARGGPSRRTSIVTPRCATRGVGAVGRSGVAVGDRRTGPSVKLFEAFRCSAKRRKLSGKNALLFARNAETSLQTLIGIRAP
jgi:hypothetical protein